MLGMSSVCGDIGDLKPKSKLGRNIPRADVQAPGFLMLEWQGAARNGEEWQADKKPLQFAEDS